MEIDKTSGMWSIACSYASDEARILGLRNGYMPKNRYVTSRSPEIYELLLKKEYSFENFQKNNR